MRGFTIVVAALLSGCASGAAVETQATVKPFQMTAADREAVETAVKSSLKDPASAQFGDMRAVYSATRPRTVTICGAVNARNSYGGFAGAKPFLATAGIGSGDRLTAVGVVGIGGDQDRTAALQIMCRREGL